MNNLSKRKRLRLKNYDYSQSGYYFITICTHDRRNLFGSIVDGRIKLNHYGKIVEQDLLKMPEQFMNVKLDKYVIMPNHLHCIIVILNSGSDSPAMLSKAEQSRLFPTIPKIIGLFKSGTARKIRQLNRDIIVWQKSYYDRVIRNRSEYLKIWEYIDTNPLKWKLDKYYSE